MANKTIFFKSMRAGMRNYYTTNSGLMQMAIKAGFPFSAKCCVIDFLRSLSFEIQTVKRNKSHLLLLTARSLCSSLDANNGTSKLHSAGFH
jgi:hypothetical protein